MRRVLVLGILTVLAAVVLAVDSGDTIPSDGSPIQVTPVMRSSVQIEYGGKVIQVDPVGKYDNVEIPFVGKFDESPTS
jgi:hypothetical protein